MRLEWACATPERAMPSGLIDQGLMALIAGG
jgi:hypothetical protein